MALLDDLARLGLDEPFGERWAEPLGERFDDENDGIDEPPEGGWSEEDLALLGGERRSPEDAAAAAVRASRRRIRDAADRLVERPWSWGAFGEVKRELRCRLEATAGALAEAEEQLAEVVRRRQGLRAEVQRLQVAIRGTHRVVDHEGARRVGRRGYPSPRAVPGPVPAPPGAPPLTGRALRRELLDHLAIGPMQVADLVDLLHLSGARVNGRPSQTISNALRPLVAGGQVRRLRRGVYALADEAKAAPFG